ncbi:uncharacterized protein V1510DRAFT_441877 [Dipodascopsis tothii]|uniref:uncharacterized protein n=1 Tax=Dipodascopsis tothii TaxID=44089 RepID=UPI0034CE7893
MSIDVHWDKLTDDDRARYSETVRGFLDRHFRTMALPGYIESVAVVSFDIGHAAPAIEIKHIGDPYADFYEEADPPDPPEPAPTYTREPAATERELSGPAGLAADEAERTRARMLGVLRPGYQYPPSPFSPPPFAPPAFHSVFSSTMLPALRMPARTPEPGPAAAAGAPADGADRPGRDAPSPAPSAGSADRSDGPPDAAADASASPPPFSVREEDVQFVLHVAYKGDMRIVVAAVLRLNYPSPNFISLPVKITVSSIEIDGLAVLACILRQAHMSFIADGGHHGLAPDDRGRDVEVIKNIKVESEIGDTAKGAVLKNVGKVERFVLERLRAIVSDNMAWPGWITFEF